MTGPDEGWVRKLVVWSGCLGDCIHGKYFCGKIGGRLRVRARRWQASLRQNRGRRVLSFSETRTRHFVVAWESFRSPAPTPLRAFTAN
jgi:hypothetical protein